LIIGMFSSWQQKKKYYPTYILVLVLVLLANYVSYFINAYANFFFAIFAGIGFIYVRNIQWRLSLLRDLTMLIIICGLLFSTISFMNRVSDFEPSNEQIESLNWLSTRYDGTVLSNPKYGFIIENIADKKTLVNGLTGEKEAAIAEEIFSSYDLEKTVELLKENEIRYIWVTAEMEDGLTWDKKKAGLLFLFRNTETFKKVYTSQDVEIWRVIR